MKKAIDNTAAPSAPPVCWGHSNDTSSIEEESTAGNPRADAHVTLLISGMTCGSCVSKVQTAFEKLGGASVTVTPRTLAQNQFAEFEASVNTHSGDLSQDLKAVSELRDDQGHSYAPTRWDGSPPGGSHRRGTLIFSSLKAPVQTVTLIIHDVAKVPERTFSWRVQP